MQDASASNAGDRYHFVYAARRMLDMLNPRNNLKLIQMENVAEEDLVLEDTPETFLGVDLTEYYGGKDRNSAEKIVFVQVKYSPTAPDKRWTLNRLCSDKKTSTGKAKQASSVLRKLSNIFNAFYGDFNETTSQKVQIKLHTNQALVDDLKTHLEQVKALIAGKSNKQGAKLLGKVTDNNLRETLNAIKKTTKLSWERLAGFLKSWDLSDFDQAMLSRKHAELFKVSSQYTSGVTINNLIGSVQEYAISNRRTNITREDVLDVLYLKERDFWPAPPCFEPIEGLLFTKAAESVMKKIDSLSKGMLLVHGVGGTGKTSVLRLIEQYYGDGKSIVIYDCFADGSHLQLGEERFPYDKCFVQITNELDGLLHTNILATTRLEHSHLIEQFKGALKKASLLAKELGYRLVIVIDAVDNAVYAASCTPVYSSKSFVPLLWKLNLPENCVLILTSRTENIPDLHIDCEYEEIKVRGFTLEETASYIRFFWNAATDDLVSHIHQRTRGNPRVQLKLIEQAQHEPVSDYFSFVSQAAKENIFAYYQDECSKRLPTKDDRIILAILLSTIPIQLDLLSAILALPAEEVRIMIERLYFGLQINNKGIISWKDIDFQDFLREYVKDETPEAQSLLAEYCQKNYGVVEYATLNLSRHFYLAGGYEKLFDWWINGDRLSSRIVEAPPHEEDIFSDIQYTLLAADKIGQFTDAVKLLSLAAEIRQGRDVFSAELKQHIPIAIECQYLPYLLAFLEERESDYEETAGYYFAIARNLAEREMRPDLAEELIEKGYSLKRQHRRRSPQQKFTFSLDEIRDIAVFEAYADSLETALKRIQTGWKPQETIYPIYAMVTSLWANQRAEETYRILRNIELDEPQQTYSLVGLLSVADGYLNEETLRKISSSIIESFAGESFQREGIQNFIIDIVEHLLHQKLTHEAKAFLRYCSLPKFKHRSDAGVIDFLKIQALSTVLGVETFNPDKFELENLPEHLKERKDYKQEQEEALQAVMKALFPPLVCRAKALADFPPEEITQEIQQCLNTQISDLKYRNYAPQHYGFADVACSLLEAIAVLPGSYRDLVLQICGLDSQDEQKSSVANDIRYAAILSKDARYLRQAEELIERCQKAIRTPDYPANEAVQVLLKLYPLASKFDKELASDLFNNARLIASEWNGMIGGRMFALLEMASHSNQVEKLTDVQLAKLATVFEYMKRVAFEDSYTRVDEAIRLIARIKPSFAFNVLENLDRSNLLTFGSGIGPIALGMLDAQELSPEILWPLSHFAEPEQEAIQIYYSALSQQLQGQREYKQTLRMLTKYIRTTIPLWQREAEARRCIQWAAEHGLKDEPITQSMQKYADTLKTYDLQKETGSYFQERDSLPDNTAFIKSFFQNLNTSPQCALKGLQDVETDILRGLGHSEMERIIDRVIEILPSSQISDFVPFVERWASASYQTSSIADAFSLMNKLATGTRTPEKLRYTIKDSFQRLLTPSRLRLLTHESYTEEFTEILHCEALELETRFSVILSAVTDSLKELRADNLYKLVGHLGELLPPDQTVEIFHHLLDRFCSRLQIKPTYETVQSRETLTAFILFLSDRLGDPRQTIRWKAMYTLVDSILNMPEPLLSIVVEELRDEKHPRWMTKREWIFFTLHHLSLRIPSALKPYTRIFLEHALSKDFPHAKIRAHAKEILLNIEKGQPGTLTADEHEKVQLVNEPKEFLSHADLDHFTMIPYEGTRWSKRHGLFTFNSMDTLPYWYSPLSHCFGMHRCHVAEIAYKWIVEKWGITDEQWYEEREKNEGRYDWLETSNRHGSEPAIESLNLYAERHGMFMAAGELIDSQPVLVGRWQDEKTTQWHGWSRLRAADPSLPGRLIDAPPLIAENYGSFTSEYEKWRKKEREEEFRNELFLVEQPDWIVVAGKRTGDFGDRQFDVHIESALVHPKTALALTRLIHSQGFVPLPHYEAYHNTILSEFEYDLANRLPDEIVTENEITDDDKLFVLKAWLVNWLQEMPFHAFDPKWPDSGRGCYLPGADFCKCLDLYRDPMSLTWKNEDGETIAYCQIWHDYENKSGRGDYTEGDRLIVRRGEILKFLRIVGLDMIFVVTISRRRSYRFSGKGSDDYDPGTRRAYILTSEGEIR